MSDNLKEKTKKGLFWSAAGNFANQGITFVFSIILARLLSPDAYGVIGMLSFFICIVSVFIDCGFSQALITKQNRTQTDFSTEFYFNIVVGFVGYLLLFLASPYIAQFYKMPLLSPILKVVGLNVFINSLCVVQSAQFAIRLDFKTPSKISVSTNIFSGIIGIFLAYSGWGVWALVFQQFTSTFLRCILLWIIAKWRPTKEFSKESFKYLWGYGSKILGSSLISQIYDNIQPLIIGKAFSSRTLGLYSRAQGFATLPSSNLSSILNNVTFPVLTKLQDEPLRLSTIYRRMLKVTGFIVFPLMIGLAAVSDPLIKTLLNEQWYDCIILLKIICFSLIWQPISAINLNILKAVKRPDIVLKLEFIKKPLGLLFLFVSSFFGIIEFCLGNLCVCMFAVIVNTIYTSKVLNVPFRKQCIDLLQPFFYSTLMGCLVYLIVSHIDNSIIALLIGIIGGCFFYLIMSKLFMKDIMKDALSMIRKK